jgi:hypothetical protein
LETCYTNIKLSSSGSITLGVSLNLQQNFMIKKLAR